MVNKGVKKAAKILVKMLGEEIGHGLLGRVSYNATGLLPANVIPPTSGWMAYCYCYGRGLYTIYINPNPTAHNNKDEVALSVGHELCHVYQDIMTKRGMSHEGKAFKTFRKVYCAQLGYTKESF